MNRTRAALGLALVLAASACTAHPAASTQGPRSTGQMVAVASRQTPAEAEATLASLRRVDDLPLYEMTYHGDYDPLAGLAATRTPSPFGCSLFVASGDAAGGMLDWRRAMQILRDVAQPHTRWSVTYELRTGAVRVVAGKRWATVHEFRLPMR